MIDRIIAKVEEGRELDRGEALRLYAETDLLTLGRMAHGIRMRLHPERRVTFVVDRNINYTNVCTSKCRFCAFYRDEDAPDAYVLSSADIFGKIEELVAAGGTQLLMQGGLHPRLDLDFFLDLFREIKVRFPQIQNHSLSPAEITHAASQSGLTLRETLGKLRDAGLDSIPGGGAEILVDEVRREISPDKIGWQEWAAVMREAFRVSMPTTATMMFGSTESPEAVIEHLFRIRELQHEGGTFTAFIPWTYQPGNTELGGKTASGTEYLKVVAVSRIVLGNVPNLQASWVTQGAKMAQVALFFGANDLGGTMLEENVVAAAGCTFRMTQEEMVELIVGAGFHAAQRDTCYRIVREF